MKSAWRVASGASIRILPGDRRLEATGDVTTIRMGRGPGCISTFARGSAFGIEGETNRAR